MPRTHKDAGLTQLPDGRWQGRIQVNGQRHAVYGKTKAEAKAKLDALRRQAIVNGGLPEAGHKMGDLLDQWLAAGDWKPRTRHEYEHYAGLIRQAMGGLMLGKVTPARIHALCATFKSSPRKALYVYQVLHAALELATVQYQWLPTNPADRVKRPAYHERERELWTDEQCRQFLEATADSPWWPLWALALSTGCRYGELIGLRWADVDTGRRTLQVERSLQRVGKEWIEANPKTKAGRRTLCLTALAMQALQRQRALQAEWRVRAGGTWQDTGRIFTNRHGGPLEKASTQQALTRACQATGVPAISPHCQRHLAASLALQGGVPLTIVSKQLGHANVAITASIYGHALVDGAAAAEAIGKALAR